MAIKTMTTRELWEARERAWAAVLELNSKKRPQDPDEAFAFDVARQRAKDHYGRCSVAFENAVASGAA